MTETEIAAVKLALEVARQLLRETPALYEVIEQRVREYLATKDATL